MPRTAPVAPSNGPDYRGVADVRFNREEAYTFAHLIQVHHPVWIATANYLKEFADKKGFADKYERRQADRRKADRRKK